MTRCLPLLGLLLASGPILLAEEGQGEGERSEGGQSSSGASELEFVDIRLAGGLHADRVNGTDLTLMAGNIGDKTQHTVDTWSDAGIVIGLRALYDVDYLRISNAPNYKARLLGLDLVGGVGFLVNDVDDLELVAGLGRGETSDATVSKIKKVGTFTELMGELGYYHPIGPVLIGGNVGFSYDKLKIDGPQGGSFSGKVTGLDLKLAVGWRF